MNCFEVNKLLHSGIAGDFVEMPQFGMALFRGTMRKHVVHAITVHQ